jgi:hypothetical protein
MGDGCSNDDGRCIIEGNKKIAATMTWKSNCCESENPIDENERKSGGKQHVYVLYNR